MTFGLSVKSLFGLCGLASTRRPEGSGCAASVYVWSACILKALAVFTGSFVSGTFAGAVGGQVSQLVRHPVSEGVIAHVSVAVDEHASAGQVREHGAGVSGGHMEAEGFGRVNVLPVRHKQYRQRRNVRLHDPNLISYQGFLLWRGSQNCVAVCKRLGCGCFCIDHLRIPACLSPGKLRYRYQK